MASIPNPQSEFLREPNLLIPGKKPVGSVKIDWANTLTTGLYTYIPFNQGGGEAWDYAQNKGAGTSPSTNQSWTPKGGNMTINNNDDGWEYESASSILAPLTVIGRAQYDNLTQDHTLICYDDQDLLIWADTAASSLKMAAYAGTAQYDTSVTINTTDFYTWGGILLNVANDWQFIIEGEIISPSVDIGNRELGGQIWIGENQSGLKTHLGNMEFLAIWTRELSAAEVKSFHNDPYQFLIPA